jgi:hypothetical protein
VGVIERCNCIMAAHCSPTKTGCRLKAGGTVNAGGGVCGPKDEEEYVPASQLRGAVEALRALDADLSLLESGADQPGTVGSEWVRERLRPIIAAVGGQ